MSLDSHSTPIDSRPQMEQRPEEAPPPARAGHPLGPLFTVERLDSPVGGRLYAAGVAAAALAVLITAASLSPDGRNIGTHRQLGLPPCGFLSMTSLPCPTCGMTTAFAYTVRGQVLSAVRAQAGGFLLAIATAGVALLAGWTALTGRRIAPNWYRINPTRLIWLIALGMMAAWALKIVMVLIYRQGPAT